MISNKQILRQEAGVVLIEIASRNGLNGSPEDVSYAVSSKRSSKIMTFDNLTAAVAYFESELLPAPHSRFALGGARF